MNGSQYSADEFVSFELPSTKVSYAETPTGRLRFVHNASHLGRPYRLQQQWTVVEHRQNTATGSWYDSTSLEWRDVECVEDAP